MTFEHKKFEISITKEQFVSLLLYVSERVNIVSTENITLSMWGSVNHGKSRYSGRGDYIEHEFTTSVLFDDQILPALVNIHSEDKGLNYIGTISFFVPPEGWIEL